MLSPTHSRSNLSLREVIINYLKQHHAATQNTMAREMRKNVSAVKRRLERMYVQGQVKFLEREERFGGALATTMCRYWFLIEDEQYVNDFFKASAVSKKGAGGDNVD